MGKPLVRRTLFSIPCALLFLACSGMAAGVCSISPSDTSWLGQTIENWQKIRKDHLKQDESYIPWMVVFDESCVYHLNPNPTFFAKEKAEEIASLRTLKIASYATAHSGSIELPDGAKIPAQLVSFAANYNADSETFLAAALPSVWRKAEHLRGEPNLESLVRSVYIHELTHTLHRGFFARLTEIEKGIENIENFDDDIVQKTFESNDAFRVAYLNEIELAKRAVAEPDMRKRRKLAGHLVAEIEKRRKRFYTGTNAGFREIEDIFLTMEGVANWAAYRSAVADGLHPEEALKLIRRSGKWWSQEEGILLFLLIDSLKRGWQDHAFAARPLTAVELLASATK